MVTLSTALVVVAISMFRASCSASKLVYALTHIHLGCGVITLQAELAENFVNSRHFERSWGKKVQQENIYEEAFLSPEAQ